jgi:hypothetical protein
LREQQEQIIKQKEANLRKEQDMERMADLARLNRVNQSAKNDKMSQQESKTLFQQEQMKLMEYRAQLKDSLDNDERNKKMAYLRSCDENERKMEQKQKDYQKFFMDYD